MSRSQLVLVNLSVLLFATSQTLADWPAWRGPTHNGIASAGQTVPLKWSEKENVLWKVAVAGRGHGSPIVVGEHVYLATAERDREARSVLCVDRTSGERVWSTDVHLGDLLPHKNKKGSDASSTPACDGERLFINFLHAGAMWTSALSLSGEVLWQTRICDYQVHQAFGSSPVVFQSLVIVIADNKLGGKVAGLDRESGKIVWEKSRPKMPNYASPVVHDVNGKPQLILTGCELVSGCDPLTGEKQWEIEGATTECVTTTPLHDDIVFSSGGYPKNHVAAIKADGSGELAWENGTRVYVPSMLVHQGHLYAVTDAGVAVCWNAATGEELWKGRLGGTFSGSPVLVNETLYVTNEDGTTYVFRANPKSFKLLAENQLGTECLSTPAVSDGKIYLRVASKTGEERQEYLYCVSQPAGK